MLVCPLVGRSSKIAHNVSPLGAGGDFETKSIQYFSKPDRTTRRIVTVKPRLRQTAVSRGVSYHFQMFTIYFSTASPRQSLTNVFRFDFSNINVFKFRFLLKYIFFGCLNARYSVWFRKTSFSTVRLLSS